MVNFDKSHVISSPNTLVKFTKIMRKSLGVSNKSKTGRYLGCSMEVDGRSTSEFYNINTKIIEKILSWKIVNLSQVGKLILINTILTTLASHIIYIYLLPRKITNKITSTLLMLCYSSSMEPTGG